MALGPGPAGLKFWTPQGLTADNTADINDLPAGIGDQFNPWGPRRGRQDFVRGMPPQYMAAPFTLTSDAGSYSITGVAANLALGHAAGAGSYIISGSAAGLTINDPVNLPAGANWSSNPWGPRRGRQYWTLGAFPPVPVVLTAAGGSYTITGTAAILALGHAAGAGSYALTGSAANLALGHAAGAGSYALTGSAANLALGHVAGAGSYSLTGADAGLTVTGGVDYLPAGLTGGYAPWRRPYPVSLLTGTSRVLGAAAPFTLTADGGSYALTGSTAGLTVSGAVNMPAGMTGGEVPRGPAPRPHWFWSVAYTTVSGTTLSADGGSYALSGSDAELTATNFAYVFRQPLITRIWARSRTVAVNSQVWVLRNKFVASITLSVDAGSYSLTGSNAGWALVHTAGAGAYTLTGGAAALASAFPATAGSYVLTGSDVNFVGVTGNYILACNAGNYATTGAAADLATGFAAGSGSYTLTGSAAGLTTPGFLVAGTGAYNLTGADANLIQAGTIVLSCGAGAYTITGADAAFIVATPPVEVTPPLQEGAGVRVNRRGKPVYKRLKLKKKQKRDECEELLEYLENLPPLSEIERTDLPLLPTTLSLLDCIPPLSRPQVRAAINKAVHDDDDDEDAIALLLEFM